MKVFNIFKKNKRSGGLIGYFGLTKWYYSLQTADQEKIASYFINFTTTREMLLEDNILWTDNTAVKLLTNLAQNAASLKNHRLCDLLMDKARELITGDEDSKYYGWLQKKISKTKQYIPDQIDIDIYKNKILEVIRYRPGILQRDIKLQFPTSDDACVGHALSQLKYENKIQRIKEGNSFQLYVATQKMYSGVENQTNIF